MDGEDTQIPEEQGRNRSLENLKPYQFKPGQSGNPGGRPKGTISLKEYAKRYLREMSDDEKLEYLTGIDKDKVWEMAEDKAKQGVDGSLELTSKIVSVDE